MKKILIALVAVAGLVSCSSDDGDKALKNVDMAKAAPVAKGTVESLNLNDAELSTAALANEAAIAMIARMEDGNDAKNFALSPLSLTTAMAMLANGADGSTLEELLASLWKGATLEQVNALYAKLAADLPRLDKDVTFTSANSVWVARGYEVLPAFTQTATQNYHADVARDVVFGQQETSDAISQWVSNATSGVIKDFGRNFSNSATSVALINALYFNGKWRYPFDAKDTQTGTFRNAAGNNEQVPMMHNEVMCYCAGTQDVTMVELDYGKGKYYLQIIMPDGRDDIHTYASRLTAERLAELDAEAKLQNISLYMPRFAAQTSTNLNDLLSKMGINIAFTREADFSRLSDRGAWVSSVMQDVSLSVNEEGTEATAATGVIDAGAASIDGTIRINRPFLYLLRERETGTIILAGKVATVG